jgi:protein-disulfide isomerase
LFVIVACGPAGGTAQNGGQNEAEASPTGDATITITATAGPQSPATEGAAQEVDAPPGTEEADGAALSIEVQSGSLETDAGGLTVGFTRDGQPFRGQPDAPVVLEEFSDFQCPYCGRFFQQTLPSLEENQIAGGEVVMVFYDFPLTRIHPQARAAHLAAHCAAEEGAATFWAMHDLLFESIDEWAGRSNTTELFTGYAEELQLASDEFRSCLESERYAQDVQDDLEAGTQRGVNSTPTFFLNGQRLTGAQPLAVFEEAIATVNDGGQLAGATSAPPQQPAAAPTPASLDEEYAAALGDPQAPVTIVEFTDYQCPYCSRHAEQTLPRIIEQFVETGQVYYVLKDLPLTNIHPEAKVAAAAARCAGEQDEYWQMHDALFARQPLWAEEGDASRDVFVQIAGDVGLDTGSFAACLDSGRHDEAIDDNFAEAQALGANGTPYFFIDGYPVPGAQPIELFEYAVDLASQDRLSEAYAPQTEPEPQPGAQEPVEVPLGDAPSIGDPQAPVVIVEYTDFQCPYCLRHFQQTYPQIVENFVETGQVRYVFKDFPLTNIHPQAVLAAEAARCARDQEAYLEMHDLLFQRQQQWSGDSNAAETFVDLAAELDLDTGAFAECLDSGRHEAGVRADLEEGSQLGVTGTPGFFINGNYLSGAQPYAVFEQAIRELSGQSD